jgi:hypothetical protein
MNKPATLLLTLVFALPFFVQAQDKNGEFIDWSANRRLDWNDYKCSPDPNSDAAATTTTYLGLEYKYSSDNSFTYKIDCKFSKDKSWGLYKNNHILGHEQGHFDITEIFARKLNKVISEYRVNKRTYQRDLESIYNDITREKEDFQNQYDEETDYSRNKVRQAEWLRKIDNTLEEYQDYAYYNHGTNNLAYSHNSINTSGANKAMTGNKRKNSGSY